MRERNSRSAKTTNVILRAAFCYAATVPSIALLVSGSPALAQWACTTAASGSITCTNSGANGAGVLETTAGNNQSIAETNSGTNTGGIVAATTAANSGITQTNSGNNTGGIVAATDGDNSGISQTNSGTNTGGIVAATAAADSGITQTNFGNNTGGLIAATVRDNSGISQINSGSNAGGIIASTIGANSGISQINSGNNVDSTTATTAGVNSSITQTNSGSDNGMIATTLSANSSLTQTNSGNENGMTATTVGINSPLTQTNSGSDNGMTATTVGANSSLTQTNSGNENGMTATTGGINSPLTQTNSGNNAGGIFATTIGANSPLTLTNSGSNAGGIFATTVGANSPLTLTNSGFASGPVILSAIGGGSTSSLTNTGIISGVIDPNNPVIVFAGGPDTMTNVVGSRVIGFINLVGTPGTQDTVNFVGGNWLFTFNTLAQATINTHGAPFVVINNSNGTGTVAVLDPTVFALADRALLNFTGDVAQMLRGRFDGMTATGAGGPALGFAPSAPSTPGVGGEAQAAFSGIPSVAMSYASDARRPLFGKAPPATVPYYDTTIWASGFGGQRKQNADGAILPATDTAYGGALGIDRAVGGNLRLGAFVGAGASSESVELSVQSIDATYVFGGVYGRLDWVTQYLDFSLYGGGIRVSNNTSGFADNLVPTGFVNATANNSGGWFVSPELTYGYRIPVKDVLVTPRASLRYVGASLDGFSEGIAGQGLSVGRRAINDLEERLEVEFRTAIPVAFGGALKSTLNVGAIGLERLGNPNIDTVLLGQNLSFVTPGRADAVGGVLGAGLEYRPMANVGVFVRGEGTAMSDKSHSIAAIGGARVSF